MKKKPEVEARKRNGKTAASSKASSEKVPGRAAPKHRASKSIKEKSDPAKQRKIRVPDAIDQDVATEQELDPFEIAKRTVKGSVPAIVETMVERAKQGSCSHAKTLLELAGGKRMFDGESGTQDSGEQWAKLVLERLGEAESAAEREALRVQPGILDL